MANEILTTGMQAGTRDDGLGEVVGGVQTGGQGELAAMLAGIEARGTEPGMTDAEFQASVHALAQDAADYIDEHIAPKREILMRYYRGEPFGNENEDRSQIVLTEVRDTINQMLPGLLRIFCGAERAVEFDPRGAEDEELALQQTEYINYVVQNDNRGFVVLHNVMKDALTVKTGVLTWWWDETEDVQTERYTSLMPDAVGLVISSPDVEVVSSSEQAVDIAPGVQIPLTDMIVRRRSKRDTARIECVAPEEFIIDRKARGIEDADIVGWRRRVKIGELVARGYDVDDLLAYADGDNAISDETRIRNPAIDQGGGMIDPSPMAREVVYAELYLRADRDGDGIAEQLKVCTLGDQWDIAKTEPAPERPFAMFTPFPTPHQAIGESLAERVVDLQLFKSMTARSLMNNLADSTNPRPVVAQEGADETTLDDVLNPEAGHPIRVSRAGAVTYITPPFVGQQALLTMEWHDRVREQRTGMNAAATGLDADVLKSETAFAASVMAEGAQAQPEMIARVFAETGMRDLFRGLYRLIVRHQTVPRTVRLLGKWVPVDPRSWNADMDVVVNVGLGRGQTAQRMGALMAIAQKQEQIIGAGGFSNPLVGLREYRHTLAAMTELAGYKNAGKFFKEIPPEAEAAMQGQGGQAQQQGQAQAAQAIQIQAQADVTAAQIRAQTDMQKAAMQDDLARDEAIVDALLKAHELSMKYGVPFDPTPILMTMRNAGPAQ